MKDIFVLNQFVKTHIVIFYEDLIVQYLNVQCSSLSTSDKN